MNTSSIAGLLIAALGGAAVGLERQIRLRAERPAAPTALHQRPDSREPARTTDQNSPRALI
jgi:hypothetical protein